MNVFQPDWSFLNFLFFVPKGLSHLHCKNIFLNSLGKLLVLKFTLFRIKLFFWTATGVFITSLAINVPTLDARKSFAVKFPLEKQFTGLFFSAECTWLTTFLAVTVTANSFPRFFATLRMTADREILLAKTSSQ